MSSFQARPFSRNGYEDLVLTRTQARMILVFYYLVNPEARPPNFEEQLLSLSLPSTPIIKTTETAATSSTTTEAAVPLTNPAPMTSLTSGSDSLSVSEVPKVAISDVTLQPVNACGDNLIVETSAKSAPIDFAVSPDDPFGSTRTPRAAAKRREKRRQQRARISQRKLSSRKSVNSVLINGPAGVDVNGTASRIFVDNCVHKEMAANLNGPAQIGVVHNLLHKQVAEDPASVHVEVHKSMAANRVSGCTPVPTQTVINQVFRSPLGSPQSPELTAQLNEKRLEIKEKLLQKKRDSEKAVEIKRMEREAAYEGPRAEASKTEATTSASEAGWTVISKRGDKPKSQKPKKVDVSKMLAGNAETVKPQVKISRASQEALEFAAAIEASKIEAAKVEAASIEASEAGWTVVSKRGDKSKSQKPKMVDVSQMVSTKVKTQKDVSQKKAAKAKSASESGWTVVVKRGDKPKSHKPKKVDVSMMFADKVETVKPQREVSQAAKEAMELKAAIDASKAEAAKIEATEMEAAKIEAARVEAAIEASRIEAAKIEAARIEAARVEAARIEAAKVEAAEAAKIEAAKVSQEVATETASRKVTFNPVLTQYEIPNRQMIEASQESPSVVVSQPPKSTKSPEVAERKREKRRRYRARISEYKRLSREAEASGEAVEVSEKQEAEASEDVAIEAPNAEAATDATDAETDAVGAVDAVDVVDAVDAAAHAVDPFGSTKSPHKASKRRDKRRRQRARAAEGKRLLEASEATDPVLEYAAEMESFVIEATRVDSEMKVFTNKVEIEAFANEVAIKAMMSDVEHQQELLLSLKFEAEDAELRYVAWELKQERLDADIEAIKADIVELESEVDSSVEDDQPVAGAQEVVETKEVVEVDEILEEDNDAQVAADIAARWVALGIPPRFKDWSALSVDSDSSDKQEESEPETTSPKVPSAAMGATSGPLKPEITITPTDSITPNDPLTPEDVEGNPIDIAVETTSGVSEYLRTEMVKQVCEAAAGDEAMDRAAEAMDRAAEAMVQAAAGPVAQDSESVHNGEPNALGVAEEDASTDVLSAEPEPGAEPVVDAWEGSWLQARVSERLETIMEEDEEDDEESESIIEVRDEEPLVFEAEYLVFEFEPIVYEAPISRASYSSSLERGFQKITEIKDEEPLASEATISRSSQHSSLDQGFGSFVCWDPLVDGVRYGAEDLGDLLYRLESISSAEPLLGERKKKRHLIRRMASRCKRLAKRASAKIGSKVEDAFAKVAEAKHQRPTEVGTGSFHWDSAHVEACMSLESESCSSPKPRRHRVRKFFGMNES